MRENSRDTRGKINCQRKKIKKIKINILFLSRNERTSSKLFGKTEKRILEPSSGGMGMRLNVARIRFIKTIITAIWTKASPN